MSFVETFSYMKTNITVLKLIYKSHVFFIFNFVLSMIRAVVKNLCFGTTDFPRKYLWSSKCIAMLHSQNTKKFFIFIKK